MAARWPFDLNRGAHREDSRRTGLVNWTDILSCRPARSAERAGLPQSGGGYVLLIQLVVRTIGFDIPATITGGKGPNSLRRLQVHAT